MSETRGAGISSRNISMRVPSFKFQIVFLYPALAVTSVIWSKRRSEIRGRFKTWFVCCRQLFRVGKWILPIFFPPHILK